MPYPEARFPFRRRGGLAQLAGIAASPTSRYYGTTYCCSGAILLHNRQMSKNDLLCLMASVLLSSTIADRDSDHNTQVAVERAEEIWELVHLRNDKRPR